MAKKGLSYGPSESLIRGAAAIGQSKLPTDMKGLQAITIMGSQEIEKERTRVAEAREKVEDTIAKVLSDGGTLSEKHFEEATKLAKQYKEEYMRGVFMNNTDGNVSKTKALNDLQKLSNSSNEEVELRNLLANIKDGNVKGVEFSDNLDIVTFEAYLNHDYEFRYEDGKKIYKIDGKDYTYEDMKKFANDIKNPALTNTNLTEINNLSKYIDSNEETKTKIFQEKAFETNMLNSIATEKRDFLNQMKDTEIGGLSMEDFITNASGDILNAFEQILPGGYDLVDMNGDNVTDDKDKALMIKDALLNPENGAFNVDNSRKTIAKVLTIEARNKAQKDGLLYYPPEKTDESGKDTKYQVAPGVYYTKSQIDAEVNSINNPNDGDSITRHDQSGSFIFKNNNWVQQTPIYEKQGNKNVWVGVEDKIVSKDYILKQQGYTSFGGANSGINYGTSDFKGTGKSHLNPVEKKWKGKEKPGVGIPSTKEAEEGLYYKHSTNGKVYLFKDGGYKEVDPITGQIK